MTKKTKVSKKMKINKETKVTKESVDQVDQGLLDDLKYLVLSDPKDDTYNIPFENTPNNDNLNDIKNNVWKLNDLIFELNQKIKHNSKIIESYDDLLDENSNSIDEILNKSNKSNKSKMPILMKIHIDSINKQSKYIQKQNKMIVTSNKYLIKRHKFLLKFSKLSDDLNLQ